MRWYAQGLNVNGGKLLTLWAGTQEGLPTLVAIKVNFLTVLASCKLTLLRVTFLMSAGKKLMRLARDTTV